MSSTTLICWSILADAGIRRMTLVDKNLTVPLCYLAMFGA
jgi:hypothetical protein